VARWLFSFISREFSRLATSQELLGVDGEQQFEVTPMPTAASASVETIDALSVFDSFKLFQDRARLQKPDWSPSPTDVRVVAEILESTDGVPLLIELAAAWVGRIALPTLRDGLTQRRSDYLKRSGPGVSERRHASSEACFDWSFNLLVPEEQRLFSRLSVFVGGCFAEDAAEVCEQNNAAVVLDSLRRRSLLSSGESFGQTRYRMLPTIREYATRKLGSESAQFRQRHSEYFFQVLDHADDQIRGAEQFRGLARVTADLENILEGMSAAVAAADHRRTVRYAHSFGTYLRLTSRYSDGLESARRGLRSAEALNDRALIASSHNNLGAAYGDLPTSNQSDNLRRAIECYEAALSVYTEREFPRDWASTQNNLGTAYGTLPTGDRGQNLRRATECFQAALRVYTEKESPVAWAMAQNNLGISYRSLATGDRGENLERAIECYEAALRVYTEREFPIDWATTQTNLGVAYRHLPTGDRGENLQRAIECYQAALRVRTERDLPRDWASTQNNLGIGYGELPRGDRNENLRRGIGCFEAASRVRTESEFPIDWASTQNNLGNAYGELSTGDRGENLRRAIGYYEAALRVYTERELPMDWAMTQNNLGNVYAQLPMGEQSENLRRAISCYKAALRVRIELEFPIEWARTQSNLGSTYENLATNDHDESLLQQAILSYEAAIRGFQGAGLIDDAERMRRRVEEIERRRPQ
jgi:predicted ATPase